MRKQFQKILSCCVCVAMVLAILPANVFAIDEAGNIAEECLVEVKNFDGTETYCTLNLESGSTVSKGEIDQLVADVDISRLGYIFAGWSMSMGDVNVNYSTPEYFSIDADTVIYAVYRNINPDDVDVQAFEDLCIAIDGLESSLNDLGITMDTVIKTPSKSDEFYEYLREYLQLRFPDEMTELENVSMATTYISERTASVSASRKIHALEDAKWMLKQHPDLNFAKEFVYQYTSHYIDVNTPFSGTYIECDNNAYQKYVTDYCREVYDAFYRNGRAFEIWNSLTSLVSVAAGYRDSISSAENLCSNLCNTIKDRTNQIANIKNGFSAWGLEDNIVSIIDANSTLMNDYYKKIVSTEYSSKEALFAEFDKLMEQLEDDLVIDADTPAEMTGKLTKCLAFTVFGIATCNPISASIVAMNLPIFATCTDILTSFLDKVNHLAMMNAYQSRLSDRMMYAWGWSNGRK